MADTNQQQFVPLPPSHDMHSEGPVGREATAEQLVTPDDFLDHYFGYVEKVLSGESDPAIDALRGRLITMIGPMDPAGVRYVYDYVKQQSEDVAKSFERDFGAILAEKHIDSEEDKAEPSVIENIKSEEPRMGKSIQPDSISGAIMESDGVPTEAQIMGAEQGDASEAEISKIKMIIDESASQIAEYQNRSFSSAAIARFVTQQLPLTIREQLVNYQKVDPDGFEAYLRSKAGDPIISKIWFGEVLSPVAPEQIEATPVAKVEEAPEVLEPIQEAATEQTLNPSTALNAIEPAGGANRQLGEDGKFEKAPEVQQKGPERIVRIHPVDGERNIDLQLGKSVDLAANPQDLVDNDLKTLGLEPVEVVTKTAWQEVSQGAVNQPEVVANGEKHNDVRPMNEKREVKPQPPVVKFDKKATLSQRQSNETNNAVNVNAKHYKKGLLGTLSGFFRKKNQINTSHVAALHQKVVEARASQAVTEADDKHLENSIAHVGKGIVPGENVMGHAANLSRGDVKQVVKNPEEVEIERAV